MLSRFILAIASVIITLSASAQSSLPLYQVFAPKFHFGTSISLDQIKGKDPKGLELAIKHFDTWCPENGMKQKTTNPAKGVYDFKIADKFMQLAEDNNKEVFGMMLLWHPHYRDSWFTVDDDGNLVSPKEMKKRMRDYIHTVVKRYKGRIKAWNVVNELVNNDGKHYKRNLYKILGDDYVALALQYAHEADPDAILFLNDNEMWHEGRRNYYINLIKDLKRRGIRIDAMGFQCHYAIDFDQFEELEKSIVEIAKTGVKIYITEWDLSALSFLPNKDGVENDPRFNPYPNGLPAHVSAAWNNKMQRFMDLFLKHSDIIPLVSMWGISDNNTWYSSYPRPGRVDYPLLFDRNYNMKPFMGREVRKMLLKRNGTQR